MKMVANRRRGSALADPFLIFLVFASVLLDYRPLLGLHLVRMMNHEMMRGRRSRTCGTMITSPVVSMRKPK